MLWMLFGVRFMSVLVSTVRVLHVILPCSHFKFVYGKSMYVLNMLIVHTMRLRYVRVQEESDTMDDRDSHFFLPIRPQLLSFNSTMTNLTPLIHSQHHPSLSLSLSLLDEFTRSSPMEWNSNDRPRECTWSTKFHSLTTKESSSNTNKYKRLQFHFHSTLRRLIERKQWNGPRSGHRVASNKLCRYFFLGQLLITSASYIHYESMWFIIFIGTTSSWVIRV